MMFGLRINSRILANGAGRSGQEIDVAGSTPSPPLDTELNDSKADDTFEAFHLCGV